MAGDAPQGVRWLGVVWCGDLRLLAGGGTVRRQLAARGAERGDGKQERGGVAGAM